jgi:hypothetical protein
MGKPLTLLFDPFQSVVCETVFYLILSRANFAVGPVPGRCAMPAVAVKQL